MYALLWVPVVTLIILFGASIVGIGVAALIRKPEITPEDELRESTIKQFQVPNTKEALFEFTIMATAKVRPVGKFAAIINPEAKRQLWQNKIWVEKCEGVYTRARLAMRDDPKGLADITDLMKKIGVNV
jgi:hypothetical protein